MSDALARRIALFLLIVAAALCACEPRSRREGFDYDACRQGGFSREFCTVTPEVSVGPGECLCGDGAVGSFSASTGSLCLCDGYTGR